MRDRTAPKGPPPQFGLARAVEKDGKVTIEVSEFRDVVGIKLEKNVVFVQENHWSPLTTGPLGKDLRAYRLDGKPDGPRVRFDASVWFTPTAPRSKASEQPAR